MIVKAKAYAAEERPNMRGGEGTVLVTPLVKEDLPANCRLFSTIELPVGASIGYHVHENETEIFYFLSGEGRVQDDEALVDVTPGDCIVTSNGHGHAVFNTGDVPLLFVANIVLD
jgi:mannose-6-phosphate isomerase-like protein (cupin superfamily)